MLMEETLSEEMVLRIVDYIKCCLGQMLIRTNAVRTNVVTAKFA